MQRLEEPQPVENEAAQVRVTPQELAQATAAIEARQSARALHEAATIPLGEAVQQLNLEATPEELLAEVQAQRREQRTQAQPTSKQTTRWFSSKVLLSVVAVQLLIILVMGGKIASLDASHSRLVARLAQTPAVAAPKPALVDVHLLHSDNFRNLDVQVGETIRCKYDTLTRLAGSQDPAHIYAAKTPTGSTWELVRKNDGFYVRCWTTMKDAERFMNGLSGTVYASQKGALDEHTEASIEVPIRAFQNAFVHASDNDDVLSLVIESRR